MADETPDISFVIVSYNTAHLIEDCLQSVSRLQDCRKEIVVIDNASQDESVRLIQNCSDVQLIASEKNLGFGPANNRALALCRGRYIFFLNPDTRVETADIQDLIAFMDGHPEIGLAGVNVLNPDGSPQESICTDYPGQRHAKGELSNLAGSLAWVLGAGMIARSDVISRAGGFDEDFFLYGEEQDLCLRIRKMGYEIGYSGAFTITHYSGQSECNSGISEIWRKKTDAEYLFYRKHYLPETVRRIAREDLIKSKWRIITLGVESVIFRQSRRAENKLAKYKIVHEKARQVMHEVEN